VESEALDEKGEFLAARSLELWEGRYAFAHDVLFV
jgi:hypothetical protein